MKEDRKKCAHTIRDYRNRRHLLQAENVIPSWRGMNVTQED